MSETKTRFKCVIYDLGDIFFDATVWRRWLTSKLQEHRISVDYPELVRRWESLLIDVYKGKAEYWDRFLVLLDSFGLNGSVKDKLVEYAKTQAGEIQKHRELFPGVPQTLQVLHKHGVLQTVLSDSEHPGAAIEEILHSLGIGEYIDRVLTSRDISRVKTEAEAFVVACKHFGVRPSHCAFVGHNIDELSAARTAGMYTIAYNYSVQAIADSYLRSFCDLRALLLKGM